MFLPTPYWANIVGGSGATCCRGPWRSTPWMKELLIWPCLPDYLLVIQADVLFPSLTFFFQRFDIFFQAPEESRLNTPCRASWWSCHIPCSLHFWNDFYWSIQDGIFIFVVEDEDVFSLWISIVLETTPQYPRQNFNWCHVLPRKTRWYVSLIVASWSTPCYDLPYIVCLMGPTRWYGMYLQLKIFEWL